MESAVSGEDACVKPSNETGRYFSERNQEKKKKKGQITHATCCQDQKTESVFFLQSEGAENLILKGWGRKNQKKGLASKQTGWAVFFKDRDGQIRSPISSKPSIGRGRGKG